jgi:hypothetical protein
MRPQETTMDTPITHYRTVTAATPLDLDAQVMALLAAGWQLYGSPYSQERPTLNALLCQGLVSASPHATP